MAKTDSSPVSLTGHFTGQVWCRHDLSPPHLGSGLGRVLYRAQQPFGWISQQIYGSNLESMLLVRHQLMDDLVRADIENGTTQILEIASGLSGRALRMLEAYPDRDLRYIEADLPQMMAWKRERLTPAQKQDKRLTLCDINILRESGAMSLPSVLAANVDPAKPLLIITEGLVNYFRLPVIHEFWQRLHAELSTFPSSSYLFEIWPRLPVYDESKMLKLGLVAIEMLTRQRVPLHFTGEPEIVEAFEAIGFPQVDVINPDHTEIGRQFGALQKCLFRVVRAST
ncbi:class I SAM-dependent methyltransferase [Allohahella marinimesophila]|uniref:Class I SAM-dependent methyltransferase n=1 Tax=Allohahella marinimesophila TaxID=1054972 RepID=A0ABP7P7Z6_9GAMM